MIAVHENEDIFSYVESIPVIVNPVNCQGVMGAGIAKEVRRRYPSACAGYFHACIEHNLLPGDVIVGRHGDVTVLHVATKDRWRNPSQLRWVEACCLGIMDQVDLLGIGELLVPALGCGLGGLSWDDVDNVLSGSFNGESAVYHVFAPRKV